MNTLEKLNTNGVAAKIRGKYGEKEGNKLIAGLAGIADGCNYCLYGK